VISGRRKNYLKKTADKIASKGGEIMFVKADVTKYENIQNMVSKTLDRYKKIDIL